MRSTYQALGVLALGSIFIMSCSSIVRHPQVDGVKKIAIISVYTNTEPYDLEQGGGTRFDLAQAVTGKTDNEANIRNEIAQHGLDRYTWAFQQAGWQVVPTAQVIASADYKALAASGQGPQRGLASINEFAGRMGQSMYGSPPGMAPMPIDERTDNLNQLAQFCRKMGVDAVAIVNFDLGYRAKSSFFGMPKAQPAVAARTLVVNKQGEFAVVFPEAAKGERFEASREVELQVGGRFSLNQPNAALLFKEAIDKTAKYTIETLRDGLAQR